MQHGVGAVGEHRLGLVTDLPPGEGRTAGHHVGMPGGQVVEDGHLVPLLQRHRGHHAADVARTAGYQQLHPASRSLRAASSGSTSLIQTPMPDSLPARYFSFPGARRIDSTCRCSPNSWRANGSPPGAWCHAAI